MTGNAGFIDRFKQDAIAQIAGQICPVAEVSNGPGVSRHSLMRGRGSSHSHRAVMTRTPGSGG